MGFAEAYTARKMAHKREEKQNTGFAAAYEARKTQLTAAQTGKRVDVGVDPYGTGARPTGSVGRDAHIAPQTAAGKPESEPLLQAAWEMAAEDVIGQNQRGAWWTKAGAGVSSAYERPQRETERAARRESAPVIEHPSAPTEEYRKPVFGNMAWFDSTAYDPEPAKDLLKRAGATVGGTAANAFSGFGSYPLWLVARAMEGPCGILLQ